jgi:SPOR domain
MNKILGVFVCLFLSLTIFSQSGVVSSHNLPTSISPGQSFDAEFTLNKGTIGGFAKFQVDLPEGFVAANVDSKNGNFTFENQRVKIVWVSIPSEPSFTFKFKVTVPGNALNSCNVSGKFFYLENNVKKEVDMPTHTMKISGGGDVAIATTPTNTPEPVATNTVAPEPVKTEPIKSEPVKIEPVKTEPVKTEPIKTEPVKTEPVKTEPIKLVSKTQAEMSSTGNNTTASGMVYKVQLGAFSSSPAKSKFPGVKLVVVEEGGFYKALSGNFPTLEQAQKHKSDLVAKGYDCIIVTYQNGQRIGITK